MHIHTMGNKAVNYVVSAYANGGRDELRNTLVHVRNVNAEDYQRMARRVHHPRTNHRVAHHQHRQADAYR